MIVRKEKSVMDLYNIIFEFDNKALTISFAGNLDLYWSLYEKDRTNNISEVLITKENYRIYELFDDVFNRIKNCEVYKYDKDYIFERSRSLKDYEEHIRFLKESRESLIKYREYDEHSLFKNEMVEWHCDDAPYDEAHVLKIIKKDEDSYLVRFEFNEKERISRYSVRFRNRGSGHHPYNLIFMEMFHKLQDYSIDEAQIHIEEYMYQKKIEMRRRKGFNH